MTDDRELLNGYAKDRAEPAFAELARRQLDLVYAVALRKVYGDRALAQDIQNQMTRFDSKNRTKQGGAQICLQFLALGWHWTR